MMYGWGNNGWGAGMWIVMAISMLIFWAIVVFGVVALVRHFGHTHDEPTTGKSVGPEAILRERLARGDIDEEDFRQKLTVLREHG